MSKHFTREQVAEQAGIRTEVRKSVEVDRSFEMPKALYGATVGCYLGFVGIMAIGFPTPGLIIPMVIFAFFIVAGFTLPAIWTRLQASDPQKQPHKDQLSTGRLFGNGIMTHTGLLSGKDAAAQMLVLPVLIVLWGIATATIAAIVS
ncbi:hypothetical protein [Qipengyuania sp. DGS5-3]|uniref:hypothetical protein n=1 Tax=Qipengyuania sp. DGS5-3 TaxID=3349632 RepID=UPI0036D35817